MPQLTTLTILCLSLPARHNHPLTAQLLSKVARSNQPEKVTLYFVISDHLNPLYTTFSGSSPSNSTGHQETPASQLSADMMVGIPRIKGKEKNKFL